MKKGIDMSCNDAAAFDALKLLHENQYNSNKAWAGMVAIPPHKSCVFYRFITLFGIPCVIWWNSML